MFCMQCGARNADGARFCAECGAPLAQPGQQPGPRLSQPPAQAPSHPAWQQGVGAPQAKSKRSARDMVLLVVALIVIALVAHFVGTLVGGAVAEGISNAVGLV